MHHSSYLAWVRHEGTHWTRTVGHKCWNTELVTSLNHVLTPYWVSFDSEVEDNLCDISTELQNRLEGFRQAAKSRSRPYPVSKPPVDALQMRKLRMA